MIQRIREPSILGYYFHQNSRTLSIEGQMRTGILEKQVVKSFDEGQMRAAVREANDARDLVDRSMHPINVAPDRHVEHLLGEKGSKSYNSDYHALLLAQGVLMGDDVAGKPTTIGVDLGKNPYMLFKEKGKYRTIDDKVTKEKVNEFLSSDPRYEQEGFNRFYVTQSFIFYFNAKQLSRHFGSVYIDIEKLAPYLIATDSVGLGKVAVPTLEDHISRAPPHIVSRIKGTMTNKFLRKIRLGAGEIYKKEDPQGRVIAEEGPIRDWAAHTYVNRSAQKAEEFSRMLRGAHEPVYLGENGDWLLLHCEDVPKHGFDSQKFFVDSGKRGKAVMPVMREIQIQTAEQRWRSMRGRWSHKELEKKRDRIPKGSREFNDNYEGVVRRIFGEENEDRESIVRFVS